MGQIRSEVAGGRKKNRKWRCVCASRLSIKLIIMNRGIAKKMWTKERNKLLGSKSYGTDHRSMSFPPTSCLSSAKPKKGRPNDDRFFRPHSTFRASASSADPIYMLYVYCVTERLLHQSLPIRLDVVVHRGFRLLGTISKTLYLRITALCTSSPRRIGRERERRCKLVKIRQRTHTVYYIKDDGKNSSLALIYFSTFAKK